MRDRSCTAGALCCLLALAGTMAVAQSPEGVPAPSNVGTSGYPRLLPDNRVAFRVEFASFPGAHEWQVWRKSLHDFAQRIFKR